jgi:hypothetical protein
MTKRCEPTPEGEQLTFLREGNGNLDDGSIGLWKQVHERHPRRVIEAPSTGIERGLEWCEQIRNEMGKCGVVG